MPAQHRPDVIDTPLVYRTYAVVVCLGGLALAVWGKTAVVHVFGSILMAAGCFAAALAIIDDLESRQRSLLWFAGGHIVVFLGVLFWGKAIWGDWTADWLAVVLLNISLLIVYYWAVY